MFGTRTTKGISLKDILLAIESSNIDVLYSQDYQEDIRLLSDEDRKTVSLFALDICKESNYIYPMYKRTLFFCLLNEDVYKLLDHLNSDNCIFILGFLAKAICAIPLSEDLSFKLPKLKETYEACFDDIVKIYHSINSKYIEIDKSIIISYMNILSSLLFDKPLAFDRQLYKLNDDEFKRVKLSLKEGVNMLLKEYLDQNNTDNRAYKANHLISNDS